MQRRGFVLRPGETKGLSCVLNDIKFNPDSPDECWKYRVFIIAEGGSEHVQADEPDQARQLAADWFAQRLEA